MVAQWSLKQPLCCTNSVQREHGRNWSNQLTLGSVWKLLSMCMCGFIRVEKDHKRLQPGAQEDMLESQTSRPPHSHKTHACGHVFMHISLHKYKCHKENTHLLFCSFLTYLFAHNHTHTLISPLLVLLMHEFLSAWFTAILYHNTFPALALVTALPCQCHVEMWEFFSSCTQMLKCRRSV